MIKVYLSPRILPSLVDLPTEWVESQSHWYIAKVCSNECELKIALTSKGWFDCVDQHFRARPMLHKAQRRQDDQSKERSGYNIFVRTASFFWPARIEWSLMTIWVSKGERRVRLTPFSISFSTLVEKSGHSELHSLAQSGFLSSVFVLGLLCRKVACSSHHTPVNSSFGNHPSSSLRVLM